MTKLIPLLFATLLPRLAFAVDCYDRAGNDYHIDADLLRAIAFRESSFKVDALNKQNDTSYAIGLMQIHSQNFAELQQYGIHETHLKADPCMNIYTGAYYLAKFIRITGDIWKGVGAYNAGLSSKKEQQLKRQKYANEVYAIYLQIKSQKGK
ncbi:transglycosylase SLT domain-containing protein [Providencia stuartii]|uniref:transglycosylase SLT domain-containing protein n=1 Tax=Providencia stuartii TaxID=588 RepID=UPI00111D3ADE|nr:transglycosylase SLT domain-containing protein [Providencia stuartii]